MPIFIFDCSACNVNDVRQTTAPILKYVIDKRNGKGASLECCVNCARKIEENERAEQQRAALAARTPTIEPLAVPVTAVAESPKPIITKPTPVKRRGRPPARRARKA